MPAASIPLEINVNTHEGVEFLYGYVHVVWSFTRPVSARPRTGYWYIQVIEDIQRGFVLCSTEWTNIFGPIPRKMPFYLVESEKSAVLPGIGFREFYMFATERLWI